MKKTTLLLMLMISIFISGHTQTTNYGTSSGTLGSGGSYFGYFAGNASPTTTYSNSFFGHNSGRHTTAPGNTAVGAASLYSNTTGYNNVANGRNALNENTGGYENTAAGASSLYSNRIGHGNTANGYQSLYYNSEGDYNVANGYKALYHNTTGSNNIANGMMALYQNSIGMLNVAAGYYALSTNETGTLNSAYGTYALYLNATGAYNSAFGALAGPSSATPGLNNTTALGFGARPTSSNQVRIGNSDVESIGGQVSWSTLSDGRFKRDIKEDVSGLEFINKLRPVSYSVDRDAVDKFLQIPDSLRIQFQGERKNIVRQTGFVAQEVEAIIKKTGYVFHGIEAPQNEKDHYSIRYAEFVVPLVKAVQELTTKMEDQQKEIGELKQQLSNYNGNSPIDEVRSTGAVLFQNNPNPFSLGTEINMSLPETAGQATLIVYNLEGKQLKVMPIHDRGKSAVKIQGNELKPGMYIYTLIVDGQVTDTKRMILTGN